MSKEVRIHITASNLTDAEYEKLIAALESIADDIKITSDEPFLTHIENDKAVRQKIKSKTSH